MIINLETEAGVRATTWSAERRMQAVDDNQPHIEMQRAAAVADAAGFSLVGASIEDCMRFTDSNDRVHARFADALAGQAGFFTNFKPADTRLDEMFPGRAANVQFMGELSRHYAQGNLSALDVLHACRDFMNQ